jgi:hypothetical protein
MTLCVTLKQCNPPRSHTKGHEGFFFFFVSLRVTSWRIFEGALMSRCDALKQ